MSILAQGTQIYFIDPDTNAVGTVECATTFSPGGNPADQIEDTCLEAQDRSYLPGLRTPGQAAMTINADPRNLSHIRLHQLSQANPQQVLNWAVGWSDGTDAPTVGQGVASVNISAGGTGYTGTPTVTFDPAPPGGVTATGTVVQSGGVITSVIITNPGSGYLTAPGVTFGGLGSGATGTAILGDYDFVLPDTRTWFTFQGYIADFPFDFAANTVVTSALSVQRSGGSAWIPKA